jgi:hypothetical protein
MGFASATSGGPMGPDRYDTYGVAVGPRMPGYGLPGLAFRQVDREGGYAVSTLGADGNPLTHGDTGPFFGVVWAGTQRGRITPSSAFCPDAAEAPIGIVRQSDEEMLDMTVATAICNIERQVVDSIEIDVTLPFGRRYFGETRPADAITPGLELYIDEYYRDIRQAGFPLPPGYSRRLDSREDGEAGPVGPSGPGSDPGSGGNSSVSGAQGCACTCDELESFGDLGDGLIGGINAVLRRDEITRCMNQCMVEYQACDG